MAALAARARRTAGAGGRRARRARPAGRRRAAGRRARADRAHRRAGRSSASAAIVRARRRRLPRAARARRRPPACCCSCSRVASRGADDRDPRRPAARRARLHARGARPPRRAGGADPRAAGRARRRPHAVDRLLAGRPRDVRRRARPPGRAARRPAPAARGRRSSTTAAASRRSSTTPSWTPRPELVNAAAAAAALALDNERLKADLRARVEDLRISRARIVEAADAARRRLERDLHDGAQQQLVSLALDLRLLRARLKGTDAVPMVEELSDKLAVALAELRELARGIHPAILTDRGLGPAVQGLADRVPLPVEVDVELDERPAPQIEAAAYFVIAEALTNVARYAKAREARVEIRRTGDGVVVAVSDDGVGGADIEARHRPARPAGPARGARRARWRSTARRRGPWRHDPAAARSHPRRVRRRRDRRLPCSARSRRCWPGCGEHARGARARRRGRGRDAQRRPAPAPGRGRRPTTCAEIAVVTHGQASSAFWTIVRNGIEAAQRQMDVERQLPLARTSTDVDAMRELIERGRRARAGRARRLDPQPASSQPPIRARGQGRHPGRVDQLRQRRLRAAPARSRTSASPRSRRATRRGSGSRAAGAHARAVRQPGGRQRGPRPALRRLRARDAASPAARRACSRSTAQGPRRTRASGSPRPSRPAGRRRRARRSTARRRDRRARSAPAGVDARHLRLLARRCCRPSARGRIEFAVDQQPYLQGYLPIVFLAERARYGLFPAQGEVIPTGPNFVTSAERRAGRAPQRAGHPVTARRAARRGRTQGDARSPPPDRDLPRRRQRPPAAGARPTPRSSRRAPARRCPPRRSPTSPAAPAPARRCAPTARGSTAGGSCRGCCATSPSATRAIELLGRRLAVAVPAVPGRRARDGRRRGRRGGRARRRAPRACR